MPVAPKLHAANVSHGIRAASIKNRIFAVVNVPFVLAALLVVVYGMFITWSATIGSTDYAFSHQVIGVVIGIVFMVAIWRFDYHKFATIAFPLLILDVILLLLPLVPGLGVTVNGARSWVSIAGQQLQPGELAKVVTILYMAALVVRYQGHLDSGKEYLKVLGFMMIPVICIMTQPDLGTGMVLLVIGFTIMFAGGANRKWLIITLVVMVVLIVGGLLLDTALDNFFGTDVLLKTYQKNRLLVFLNNNIDPTGVGYNLQQSKIAIGSGGLFGKGIGNATQSQLGFLPEAPTDFIFCVLAEQFGFVGAIVLLVLYLGMFICALRCALITDDLYGRLAICGILGMWLFQIFENIGMDCGLMPITGIPLPFVSYGSSMMIVNFMALGIVLSVWAHRDIADKPYNN
jgi:rod shape determining protein RodA